MKINQLMKQVRKFHLLLCLSFLSFGLGFGQVNSNSPSIGKSATHVEPPVQGVVQGALAPPSYPKFLSYPTSHAKPPFIDSGDPANDKVVYEMRLQHWYFLFDQDEYVRLYGALPGNLPGGVSPEDYASSPPNRSFSQDLEDYMNGNASPAGESESNN